THGVVQSAVPWATPGSKFTLLFERLAIDWLREAAVTAVARQLKLGWDAVWGIERRAVARGLERRGTLELRYVGVDEKSFQRRHAADGHEVRLAAPSRSLHAGGVARVRGLTQQRAPGRPRLGAQGDGRGPVGVPLRRGRPQVFPPLVLLGDPLAAPAHDREGAHAQDAPAEHPHLPAPPDHQRDGRGPELEDPVDPLHRPRLPQPGELQDGDLLPLRRPRPLPTLKPEEPIIIRLYPEHQTRVRECSPVPRQP